MKNNSLKINKLKIIAFILSFCMAFNISSMEETEKVREKKEVRGKRKNAFEDEQELKRVKLYKKNYLKKFPVELKTMIAEFVAGSVNSPKEAKETIRKISSFAQSHPKLSKIIQDDKFQEYLLNLIKKNFPELSELGAKILINTPYWAKKLKEDAKADKALQNRLNAWLVRASYEGNVDNVKFFLKAGANPNYYFNDKLIFLFGEDPEILNFRPMSILNFYFYQKKFTALMAAAWEGHEKIVELLLKAGANIHALDEHKNSALWAAVSQGKKQIVKLLLKSGAKADVQSGEMYPDQDYSIYSDPVSGFTPLMEAVEGGTWTVEALLESGEDINIDAKNSEEDTALDMAKKHLDDWKEELQDERASNNPDQEKIEHFLFEVKRYQDIIEMIKDYKAMMRLRRLGYSFIEEI